MSSAPGEPVALDDEAEVVPGWRRRRRIRQRLTLAVITLLVVGAGLVAAGMYSGVIGAATEADPLPTCAPAPRRPAALAPRQVQVQVFNGSGRRGLAAATAASLRAHTFVVTKVANAPARVTSPAVVRYGAPGKAAATLLATYLPGAQLVQDGRDSTVVDLVVGRQFTAVRTKPAATKPATTKAAPATSPAPSTTCTPAPIRPSPTGSVRSRPTTTPR